MYVMNIIKMYFVRFLKDVLCMLWMPERCILYGMDVIKMYFVRYGFLKYRNRNISFKIKIRNPHNPMGARGREEKIEVTKLEK